MNKHKELIEAIQAKIYNPETKTEQIDFDYIESLLYHDPSLVNQKYNGYLPLIEAMNIRNLKLIQSLLSYGADPNVPTINNKNEIVTYPLIEAIELYKTNSLVRLLLQHGANPSVRTHRGVTPLHYAVIYSSLEDITLLLIHGADPNATDKNGHTPLFNLHNRKGDNVTCLRLLLSYGANPNVVDTSGSKMLGLWRGNENTNALDVIRILVQHGFEIDAPVSSNIETLFHEVVKMVQLMQPLLPLLINLLIELNADPNLHNKHNETPLDIAMKYKMKKLASRIMNYSINRRI